MLRMLPAWTESLQPPDRTRIQTALEEFWTLLGDLTELLAAQELLLGAERITALRCVVLELMLALNGIRRPPGTRSLNGYLSERQRMALEKTLAAPDPSHTALVGQAVALVVIYRWYAPQLVATLGLAYPDTLEHEVWQALAQRLPDWPLSITTG